MKQAASLLIFSAALHVGGVAAAGFAPGLVTALVLAAILILLAAGLSRGIRGVAWLTFVVLMFAVAWSVAQLFGPAPVPVWAAWGILGVNVVAALMVFAEIWRGREPA